jgi:uncharacterized membrane protein YecN with MAPEG domain
MKAVRYFLLILLIYLLVAYVTHCIEFAIIENPIHVIDFNKTVNALIFSVVMTIVYLFSPIDRPEKTKRSN